MCIAAYRDRESERVTDRERRPVRREEILLVTIREHSMYQISKSCFLA